MELLKLSKEGYVAVVAISRPDALNALNSALLAELCSCFEALSHEGSVRAVVLTGEGKAFAAGADIGEMKDFSPSQALSYAAKGAAAFAAIEHLPQPVIAAVNGYALGGGCELALACDIRVASEKAVFAQPETGLGITPGFGGTQRLPRAVGMGWAMEIILTGRKVGAEEALGMGLVNAVYPAGRLMEEAMRLAESIAKNAPVAIRAAKRAIRQGIQRGLESDIAGEAELFAACFDTQDQKDAMQAFTEKRKLEGFQGK